MRIFVLVAAVAAVIGCGADELDLWGECSGGKCEGGRYFKYDESPLYDVRDGIVFDSAGKPDGCDKNDREGCSEPDPVSVVKGRIEHAALAKRHVYLIDAPYGMHLKLKSTITGYSGAKVEVVGPANQYGVWNKEDTLQVSWVTGDNTNNDGQVHVQATLDDFSMRPFGLFALVIGPRDKGAFYRDDGKGVAWDYEVELTCTQNCRYRSTKGLTKYPVYFAHGFASDRTTWIDLGANQLNVANPAWRQWATFDSVPAKEPLEVRAEHLRRNLKKYLSDLALTQPSPPDGWKVNIIAHSMGGLDARYLVGHPTFNDDCDRGDLCMDEKGGDNFCCYTAGGMPESCCAPGGRPWREAVASITTLSTPHRGSHFADWLLELYVSIDSNLLKNLVGWFMKKYVGQKAYDRVAALDTLTQLSTNEITSKMDDTVLPPRTKYYYDFECAVRRCDTLTEVLEEFQITRDDLTYKDLPSEVDYELCGDHETIWKDGAPAYATNFPYPTKCYLLPPPVRKTNKAQQVVTEPTIFSWAGVTCLKSYFGFGCNGHEANAPALSLAFSHYIENERGWNDGVVSVESAKYGIFMGVLPRDHFEWSSDKDKFAQFHIEWLERLRKAGY